VEEGEDARLQECRKAFAGARGACEAHGMEVMERSASGTGEILRSNFQLLVEAILAQDGHLLSPGELAILDSYKVYCSSCVCPRGGGKV